jgi:CRISPR-associated protein Cas1
MRTVYVNRDWASIRRDGGRLVVAQKKGELKKIRIQDVDQLVLMGNVTVTPPALDLLLEKGIDTVFLTSTGRYRARIVSGISTNITLRLAQFQQLGKFATTLSVAQNIVFGKCQNMLAFLQRFSRRHGKTEAQRQAAVRIRAAKQRTSLTKSMDQVRGCEGSASAAYFGVFDAFLKKPGFRFQVRNRRPPLDPVNAMLSFGYTLLANRVEAIIRVVGLDPYLGALHAPKSGRPSLVCDLEEEFRVPIVDALIVAAINRRVIHPEDFEETGPGQPVLIRRETVATMVKIFQSRLEEKATYPPQNRKLTYRQIIEEQVRHFARVMLQEENRYVPYTIR